MDIIIKTLENGSHEAHLFVNGKWYITADYVNVNTAIKEAFKAAGI